MQAPNGWVGDDILGPTRTMKLWSCAPLMCPWQVVIANTQSLIHRPIQDGGCQVCDPEYGCYSIDNSSTV